MRGFAKVTQDVTAQTEGERLLREREQQLTGRRRPRSLAASSGTWLLTG